MANTEEEIFDAITNFTSTGTEDVLGAADEIQSAIDDLSAGVDVEIGVNVADFDVSELTDLEDTQYDVSIDATLADDSAITELEDLDGATIEPELNATESDQGRETTNKLLTIIAIKDGIELVMNVAGTVLDVIASLEQFTVAPILAGQDANAKFAAQTGAAIEEADLITKIFYDDLGDSKDQIADVAIRAAQIGAPIDEATRAALLFTHTFTEQDPTAVLNTLNQLVESGLVPNFQAATDLLTTGFQQGGNRAGDLLSVLESNSTAFSDLGLTGEQSLSLIKTGLDNGFSSAGDVAIALTTFKKNLTTGGEEVDTFLSSIGLENPTKTGGEVGAEFLNSVITGLKDAPTDGEISPDELASKLFGKQGLKNTSAVLGLSTESNAFDDLVGQAEDAATLMDDTLTGVIDDFLLAAQGAAETFLSSDALDLDGKLEDIKKAVQTTIDAIQSGTGVAEAIEIGFNIPGFADGVARFEASIGNFGIGVLELIAGVQDFLGKDSSGTREQIAGLAAGQLSFDLQSAEADEVSTLVQRALDRGVDESKITDLAGVAVDELLASGDLEQAALVAANLGTEQARVVAKVLGEEVGAINVPLTADMTPEEVKAATDAAVAQYRASAPLADLSVEFVPQIDATEIQTQVDEAIEAAKPPAIDGWWNNLKPPADLIDVKAFSEPEGAGAKGTEWWSNFEPPPETTTAVQTFGTDVDTAMTNAALASSLASDGMLAALAAMSDGVVTADEEIALGLTGNTVTASFDAVLASAEANFPAAAAFTEVLSTAVQQLDAKVTEAVGGMTAELKGLAALVTSVFATVETAQLAGATALAGGGGTTNINVNQTNNNASGAEVGSANDQLLTEIQGGV